MLRDPGRGVGLHSAEVRHVGFNGRYQPLHLRQLIAGIAVKHRHAVKVPLEQVQQRKRVLAAAELKDDAVVAVEAR